MRERRRRERRVVRVAMSVVREMRIWPCGRGRQVGDVVFSARGERLEVCGGICRERRSIGGQWRIAIEIIL